MILDGEALTIYEVAFHLKMPVYKLLDEMPYEELQGWLNYFEQRPPGWQDDDRTFKILQSNGCKEKPGAIFPSLQAIYNPPRRKQGDGFDVAGFKRSAMFQKILSAKNGDAFTL